MTAMSLLGLTKNHGGDYSGKFSPSKGTVPAGSMALLGFTKSKYEDAGDVSIDLSGVAGSGEVGNLFGGEEATRRYWSLTGFNRQPGEIPPKGEFDDQITLIGVEARGQVENLEGTDVTITLTGVAGVGSAGDVEFPAVRPIDNSAGYGGTNWWDKEERDKKERKKRLLALAKQLYDDSLDP